MSDTFHLEVWRRKPEGRGQLELRDIWGEGDAIGLAADEISRLPEWPDVGSGIDRELLYGSIEHLKSAGFRIADLAREVRLFRYGDREVAERGVFRFPDGDAWFADDPIKPDGGEQVVGAGGKFYAVVGKKAGRTEDEVRAAYVAAERHARSHKVKRLRSAMDERRRRWPPWGQLAAAAGIILPPVAAAFYVGEQLLGILGLLS